MSARLLYALIDFTDDPWPCRVYCRTCTAWEVNAVTFRAAQQVAWAHNRAHWTQEDEEATHG